MATIDPHDPARYIGGTVIMYSDPALRLDLAAAEEDVASMARLLICLLDQRRVPFITDAERNRLVDRFKAQAEARAAVYPEAGPDV